MVKQFKGIGKRAERGNENNIQSRPALITGLWVLWVLTVLGFQVCVSHNSHVHEAKVSQGFIQSRSVVIIIMSTLYSDYCSDFNVCTRLLISLRTEAKWL